MLELFMVIALSVVVMPHYAWAEFFVEFRIPAEGEVYISWTVEGPRGAGFYLYRKEDKGEFKRLNKTPLRSMPPPVADPDGKLYSVFRDRGLTAGKRYIYRIVMIDSQGDIIKESREIEFIPNDGRVPSAVRKINVEATEDHIVVNWTPLNDPEVSSYRIYRRNYIPPLKGGDMSPVERGKLIAEVGRNISQYTDRDVEVGVVYYYSVSAVDPYSGEGPISYTVPAVLKDSIPPEPPATARAEVKEDGTVYILWGKSPSADVSMYLLYRAIEADGEGILLARVVAEDRDELSYVDHLLRTSNFTYYYTIVAMDVAGNRSKPTERISVRLPDHTPPARPVITGLKVEDGMISISWAPSPDEDLAGYNIYRAELKDGKEATSERLNRDFLKEYTYVDRTVKGGVLYRYYVTAVDTSGNESLRSTGRTQRAIVSIRAVPPTDLSVRSSDKGNPLLSWRPVESEDLRGYFVYRGTSKDGGFVKVSGLIKGSTYEDRNARGYKELWYVIRACYRNGRLSQATGPVVWREKEGGERP